MTRSWCFWRLGDFHQSSCMKPFSLLRCWRGRLFRLVKLFSFFPCNSCSHSEAQISSLLPGHIWQHLDGNEHPLGSCDEDLEHLMALWEPACGSSRILFQQMADQSVWTLVASVTLVTVARVSSDLAREASRPDVHRCDKKKTKKKQCWSGLQLPGVSNVHGERCLRAHICRKESLSAPYKSYVYELLTSIWTKSWPDNWRALKLGHVHTLCTVKAAVNVVILWADFLSLLSTSPHSLDSFL